MVQVLANNSQFSMAPAKKPKVEKIQDPLGEPQPAGGDPKPPPPKRGKRGQAETAGTGLSVLAALSSNAAAASAERVVEQAPVDLRVVA